MVFIGKKRWILLFFVVLIICFFNAGADSSSATWTRAYCLYNAGAGGYAGDSGQIAGDSASCSAANGVQCAEEGDVYCYAQSSCEEGGTTNDGPTVAYNVNWDTDSADCLGKVGSGRWNIDFGSGTTPSCCGDDSNEMYIFRDCETYSEEVFKTMVHEDYFVDGNNDHEAEINQQIVTNGTETIYYACPPDDGDIACCDGDKCIYNNVCYENGTKTDIDNDGIEEVCITASPGTWVAGVETNCSNGIDDDADGLTDCEDPDCNGEIIGYVKDQDNAPLEGAGVEVFEGSTKVAEDSYTEADGSYEIDVTCGTYNLAASKIDYVPSTKTNIEVPPTTTIQQDFTLTYGITCEDDCTYLLDDKCHEECDGVNGCGFYDSTAKEQCNLAEIGWEVDYNSSYTVECCEGAPQDQETQQIKAVPSCSYGNLIKFYKIIYYKGKPIRMVTVVCGD